MDANERCENCYFWEPYNLHNDYGTCTMPHRLLVDAPVHFVPWTDEDGDCDSDVQVTMHTAPSFYCNEWRPKE